MRPTSIRSGRSWRCEATELSPRRCRASSRIPRIVPPVRRLSGAWLCGTCLGAVTMALHHKLCHILGGSFGLPHAATHAVVLPHAAAYNAAAAPEAMARLSRALQVEDAPRGLSTTWPDGSARRAPCATLACLPAESPARSISRWPTLTPIRAPSSARACAASSRRRGRARRPGHETKPVRRRKPQMARSNIIFAPNRAEGDRRPPALRSAPRSLRRPCARRRR